MRGKKHHPLASEGRMGWREKELMHRPGSGSIPIEILILFLSALYGTYVLFPSLSKGGPYPQQR